MLILLSPAKQLNFEPVEKDITASVPALKDQTRVLSKTTRNLTAPKLKSLMGISDDLAKLNRERFQSFDSQSDDGKPAALAFNGEVYRGLDAASLSKDDLNWAQDHLLILSGLYGALRPLDAIQPYRLEMGTKLHTRRGETLYDFWGDHIAQYIDAQLEKDEEPVIINLASNEYSKAAKLNKRKARVISFDFKEEKDGKLRPLMVYAKKARGMMARWIIENRIDNSNDLTKFNEAGYSFEPEGSSDDRWLFARPQPAPVS